MVAFIFIMNDSLGNIKAYKAIVFQTKHLFFPSNCISECRDQRDASGSAQCTMPNSLTIHFLLCQVRYFCPSKDEA